MPLPDLTLSHLAEGVPDPLERPQAYRGVTLRRMLAYMIDAVLIFLILVGVHLLLGFATVVTFGLLWPLHLLVVPIVVAIAYHSLQVGGLAAATIGMRLLGLRVMSATGGRPSLGQAVINTVCFYATLGFSCGILLVIALFSPQRRTLHDYLAGTVVLRNEAV
jgi:uncharacterized RDD family membrane protein YckC